MREKKKMRNESRINQLEKYISQHENLDSCKQIGTEKNVNENLELFPLIFDFLLSFDLFSCQIPWLLFTFDCRVPTNVIMIQSKFGFDVKSGFLKKKKKNREFLINENRD